MMNTCITAISHSAVAAHLYASLTSSIMRRVPGVTRLAGTYIQTEHQYQHQAIMLFEAHQVKVLKKGGVTPHKPGQSAR